MKNLYFMAVLLLCCSYGFSQVGINTARPNAQLDIKSSNPASPSNTDGILIPNIDVFPSKKPGAEQNGMMVYLAKPAAGLEPGFYFWDNDAAQWKSIASPSSGKAIPNPNTVMTGPTWLTGGNAGVTATDFIGTTDFADLVFKRNNVIAGRLGYQNTAFGTGTLTLASNGAWNTAIGVDALASNGSNGMNNVAVGFSSMNKNTTGSSNVAVGDRALEKNTTGSINTALGANTLAQNLTGVWNTAAGVSALANNTTGNSNTAMGSMAMYYCTTGTDNAAFGDSALTSVTTGYLNTGLGPYALGSNTTGARNIGIGYMAGFNEMGSDRLYIESSNSATPLIYGEFDNDLLRFNGKVKVHNVATPASEMMIKNSNKFVHSTDINLNFGAGGNDFILSSNEGIAETAGIRGDGDNVTIWSPGDGNRIVRFVDEDSWSDNNGNPYDNAAEKSYIDANGQYFQVSDKNKKDNIRRINNPIEKLGKLNGYTYQFKLAPEEISKGQKVASCSGVLAQELEIAFPEAVQKNESGEYFVDYAAVTPLLIEVAKVQQQNFENEKGKNAQLEQKVNLLEQRLKGFEEKLSKIR